jgi:hypothetical protein
METREIGKLTGVGFYIESWEETRRTRETRKKKLIFSWL